MLKYRAITLRNFKDLPQVQEYLTEDQIRAIEVVGNVLPFKANNYVIDELIDWTKVPYDPLFQLTFPQKEMLSEEHYNIVDEALNKDLSKDELKSIVNEIRYQLNPHPAGQQEKNVPEVNGEKLTGVQHKYRETALFFPSSGQTCHAYCTFCFRWPQFVGIDELKFAMKESELLVEYVRQNPRLSDILFTGGDPMVMAAKKFASYVDPLLDADLPNLKTIRIGTKALGYWPYKFLSDKDTQEMLDVFKRITDKGIHLAIMAHFNHPNELKTEAVQQAIENIRATGAQIRSQSPIMRYINDTPEAWRDMWQQQVEMGIIPYYMFVARDTGAQDYFAVSLEKAHKVFRQAYMQVSGVARTVRGPSMSADPGKVQLLGFNEINGERVMTLRFIQGRDPEWVGRPFFAKYNPHAIWLDDLEPAFGEDKFFFQDKQPAELVEKEEIVLN